MTESDVTNGNGSSSVDHKATIEQALSSYPLEDHTVISVIALFFTQQLGKASPKMVAGEIRRWGGVIDDHALDTALEGIRSRGLLSYASGRLPKTGEVDRMYKLANIKWARLPEVAHLRVLVPKLLDTPEAAKIVSVMNGQEVADGEEKQKRENKYRDFFRIEFKCRTLDAWLGAMPSSPVLDRMVREFPHGADKFKPVGDAKKDSVVASHRWLRQEGTGHLRVPSDVVRAYFRSGFYQLEKGVSSIGYLSFDEILIWPKKPLEQYAFPIIREREGTGISTHEALPAGQEFTMSVCIPTVHFMTANEFAQWVCTYAPNPRYGLSPARNARFGRFEVLDVNFVGRADDMRTQAAGLFSNPCISEEAKKLFSKLQAKASA